MHNVVMASEQPWSILNFRFSRTGCASLKLSIDPGGPQFCAKSSTGLFTSCFSGWRGLGEEGRPLVPPMESGVRKKWASETYWKIDVLLLTNDDL